MSRLRAAVLVCALGCTAAPAGAATVGLGSGDIDPQLITDPAFQLLTELKCLGLYGDGYRCAEYTNPFFALIESIDFRLKDETGALIPFPDDISADPLSDLPVLTESPLFDDGFTFRLFAVEGGLSCFNCLFFSLPVGVPADPLFVSLVAVNDIENLPEPATLLLFAPAAAVALRRRVRRSRLNVAAAISSSPDGRRAPRSVDH